MLGKYFLKSLLSNKAIWGWGVGFMAFWLFMGAFVFGFNYTSRIQSLDYASVWFSLIGLISGSIIATSISYSVYYGNASLAYSFRYTKLKPSSYILNLTASTAVVASLIGSFIIMFTALMFGYKTGYSVLPVLPLQSIGIFFLSGMFMFLLSVVLIIFSNNHVGLKNITFVVFIPQILSYLFGFSELGINLPSYVVYASPFSDIPRLLFMSYYGEASKLNLTNGTGPIMNPYILLLCLALWIGMLFVLSIILVRRIKPVSIEEGRQV
ncbi:hypothetical protein OXIME_000365 [Oxyplasma meridianum]|uniref:ABC-2 type transporter domain-containing protein n=1 Tax=Oxyplasma meridianum TaxID=3073602 RepID=A0AAX4NG64_9ARCH